MFSYWRNTHSGQCHMSLAGTVWPSPTWEQISDLDYYLWKKAEDEKREADRRKAAERGEGSG